MGGARKIILPKIGITEVASAGAEGAVLVSLWEGVGESPVAYYVRPVYVATNGRRWDGRPEWDKHQYGLFPVVDDGKGCPWAEATMYILARLEGVPRPVMTTYACIAEDLAAYYGFLEARGVDWMRFPEMKLSRPTYQFHGYLKMTVFAGEIAASTAKRRMGAVISFYRWLRNEKLLLPEYPPWKESDRYIDFRDRYGFDRVKKVITTDISIRFPEQIDPYSGSINDGGKLTPLTLTEQEWLLDALCELGNTEMTLIHLMGLVTGARLQTVLTFGVRHVLDDVHVKQSGEIRIPIGPGTGIDTKNNKKMVLHVPVWLFKKMQIYANSSRAKKRRERARGGDCDDQYMFLTTNGNPFYVRKEEGDESVNLRYRKMGQGVRQFIYEKVIPHVRAKTGVGNFNYRFHDTRATAGMNWTDHQLRLVALGKATLTEARDFVRVRMGHESYETTDRYLQLRRNLGMVRHVAEDYESHLEKLSEHSMEGLN